MAQHGQHTTLQQRVELSERAAAGLTDRAIATELDCSQWTVRKWQRIAQREGRAALSSHLGRPATGPLSTCSPLLQHTMRQWRLDHPGWGPDTILANLRADLVWHHHPLPSRARLAAFLKHSGLTRRYQRHAHLPRTPQP